MTIFAVLMPSVQPILAQKILQEYPADHLVITDTQYLISSSETVLEVTAKLKIVYPQDPAQITGSAIVFATSSYYGRAPAVIWDWIKSKLEAPSNG